MSEAIASCIATVGCHRPALHGMVCGRHRERLGAILAELETEAAVLSTVPSMQQRTGPGGGLASHRSPARLDVLVHLDPRSWKDGDRKPGPACHECWHDTCMDIRRWADAYDAGALETLSVLGTLHSWARLVREERQLSTDQPATVSGECGWLQRHLDWICEQPWIDECYGDLSALLRQLRVANGHRPDKPYSKCPVVTGGENCTGDVWVQDEFQHVWRRYSDRCAKTWESAPGAAVCDTCGAVWKDDGQKARLKRMVKDAAAEAARPRTDDGRPMLTAQELVEQGHVSSVSNVRVQAHRRGVRAVGAHYDPEWFSERMTG